MRKLVFLIIAGFGGIISLAAQTGFTTHTSKAGKYKISYPSDWSEIDKSVSPLLDFGANSALENGSDKFAENFNVVIDNNDLKGMSLDEYSKLTLDAIKTYLPGSKIISKGFESTTSGTRCAFAQYTHAYDSKPLKVLVYMYIANNKAYVVTCTAEIDNFDSYLTSFLAICRSMEFTK